MNHKKKNTKEANDEVEELLRAAEDAALLKLNLNSHTVHASPSDLHPDLEQRFQNLKTGSKMKAEHEGMTKKKQPPKSAKENEAVEEDDLLARYAALKSSMPKPSPLASSSIMGFGTSDTSVEDKSRVDDDGDGDDEEDEVEKVIRWAMDAARLNPSPDSDDEDIIKGDDFEDSVSSDAEEPESPLRNLKGQQK